MNDLFEWSILIILAANTLGLLLTILLTLRLYLSIIFPISMVVVFASAILLNVIFPGRWWSLSGGFVTSFLALMLLVGYVYSVKEETNQTRGLSENDQAVVDDFRKWASGGSVVQENEVSGFSAYAKRGREIDRDTGVASQNQDPVCSKCGTVYNREVVISLIKQQSPEIFAFQTWTTKFLCKQCREEIVISGEQ